MDGNTFAVLASGLVPPVGRRIISARSYCLPEGIYAVVVCQYDLSVPHLTGGLRYRETLRMPTRFRTYLAADYFAVDAAKRIGCSWCYSYAEVLACRPSTPFFSMPAITF